METISVNRFRENLKACVEKVIDRCEPLKVSRRGSEDFIVVSADDWERQQETLYVLQNQFLMKQIGKSLKTHQQGKGREASASEVDNLQRREGNILPRPEGRC